MNRRRELGIIAGLFSDQVIITCDDPGMECQEDIAGEVRTYVELTGCPVQCISERREAVEQAVRMAAGSSGPALILLLGRGSERFQQIKGQARPYPTDSCLMQGALEAYNRRAVL